MNDTPLNVFGTVLIALLAATFSTMFAFMFYFGGTTLLLAYCFAAVALAVYAAVHIGPAIWCSGADTPHSREVGIKFALFLCAIVLIPPAIAIYSGESEAISMRRSARDAQMFAVAHFNSIDANGDGTLDYDEIRGAGKLQLSPGQNEHLSALVLMLRQAGHVTRSYQVYKKVRVGSGKTHHDEMRWVTVYEYGFNRDDLRFLLTAHRRSVSNVVVTTIRKEATMFAEYGLIPGLALALAFAALMAETAWRDSWPRRAEPTDDSSPEFDFAEYFRYMPWH